MLDLIRKSILVGAGLTLLTADKVKDVMETLIREGGMSERKARDAWTDFVEKSEEMQKILDDKKKKVLNEAFAFWLYGVPTDEIEERLEKVISATLEQLHFPRADELEEIRRRIEALEERATGHRQ